MKKVNDLTIEQQKKLLDFSINNINLIESPQPEIITYFLKLTNYEIANFITIDNPDIIKDICVNAPQKIVNNRKRINATLNELYEYNPKILNYLDLVVYTKEPVMLDSLRDEILLFIFEKHSAPTDERSKDNPCYSLDKTIINKCSQRVQRLYMKWVCSQL